MTDMTSPAGTGQAFAVEMRNVSKVFGETTVLDRISFDIRPGEFVTFLGPSGCGKTTSLRILAGFEQATSGDVRINGHLVSDMPPWHRDIGIVFQSYALFPYMTARDNVGFGLKMRRVPKSEIALRVDEALKLVGLSGLGDRYPRQLSGGQRQRVALARALVIKPQLLLLDEPLSNLDAKLRNEMRYELKRIQRESGITTVFVTHDQEEAFSLSDRIVLMSKGEIKQAGTSREIWEKPRTGFVADFIGVDNLLSGTVEKEGDKLVVRVSPAVTLKAETCDFAPGSKVLVAVRAKDAVLTPVADAIPTGPNVFAGEIMDIEYRGERCACRVRCDGIDQTLVALVDSSQVPSGSVILSFAPDAVMVLADDR
jgi:putative spermidine/putrescine transport system ATP-binding protein